MTVPQGPPPVTYLSGTWIALVYGDVVLLAESATLAPVVTACWTAVVEGAGFDGVLGAIAQAGPDEVPSFALVGPSAEGGTRLVVSGKAQAEVAEPGRRQPLTVSAVEASKWNEQRLPGRPALHLLSGTTEGSAPSGAFPLAAGVALASVVGVGVAADTRATPAAPEPVAPADAAPAPAPADEAPVEPGPRTVSNDTMPPHPNFDSRLIDPLPWRAPAYAQDSGEQPVASGLPATPEPTPYPAWGDPQQAQQPPNPQNPWAPVQQAWPEPAAAQQAWPPPAPPTPAWPEPGPVQPVWPQPGPANAAPAAPAAQNPWGPPGQGSAPPPAQAPVPAGPPASSDPGSAPIVHAFVCPRQHLNPPYAGTCRICHEPIPAQEGFAAPRPSLGVLTLSTGDTVPLDRDVVLGRAPFHPNENEASRPHLVQLASPGNDISRSHVRVNLENWFVQVTDLGSTNGTVVTLPDQAPVRLRPHDPFTILPGTTLNLADEVTLRYEVPS
ncbi:MAG: FHA domain-containing protein [Jatrophihabitans sp.]